MAARSGICWDKGFGEGDVSGVGFYDFRRGDLWPPL
jgi:hypothetical protein